MTDRTRANPAAPVDWVVTPGLTPYDTACALMAERVEAVIAGKAPELVWLLQHPPLYTAGASADPADLLDPHRFPVHRSGRGGRHTYHGPGQRVGYMVLDVGRRFGDVRAYVAAIEDWVIDALARLHVASERYDGRVGVWVRRGDGRRAKIAAIGVRLRRWVSSHGFSLNVAPDLDHFAGIVPCGIREEAVTSLADLGLAVAMDDVDEALRASFEARFGALRRLQHIAGSTAQAGPPAAGHGAPPG